MIIWKNMKLILLFSLFLGIFLLHINKRMEIGSIALYFKIWSVEVDQAKKLIIDGGSCSNVVLASTVKCSSFQPNAIYNHSKWLYRWCFNTGNWMLSCSNSRGAYPDSVWCDMILMIYTHLTWLILVKWLGCSILWERKYICLLVQKWRNGFEAHECEEDERYQEPQKTCWKVGGMLLKS